MFSMRQKLSNGSLLAQGLRPYQAVAGQLAMAQPFSVLPLSYRMFAKFERNKPHLNVGTIGKFDKCLPSAATRLRPIFLASPSPNCVHFYRSH